MNSKTASTALASLVALGSLSLAGSADAAPKWAAPGSTIEKCGGVAHAGKNDCGANGHQCGGMAKKDNDPKEWVWMPEGVCVKVAGGKVLGSMPVK